MCTCSCNQVATTSVRASVAGSEQGAVFQDVISQVGSCKKGRLAQWAESCERRCDYADGKRYSAIDCSKSRVAQRQQVRHTRYTGRGSAGVDPLPCAGHYGMTSNGWKPSWRVRNRNQEKLWQNYEVRIFCALERKRGLRGLTIERACSSCR